jgi:hypothetical protein
MREPRQKLRDRYKLGFDRLAVVVLVAFAAAFALMALAVNDPYSLPEVGTAERQAIEAAVADACAADQIDALAILCRERAMSGYRWAHYRTALAEGGLGWLYGFVLAGLGLAALVPAARWVASGFRSVQSAVSDRSRADDRK